MKHPPSARLNNVKHRGGRCFLMLPSLSWQFSGDPRVKLPFRAAHGPVQPVMLRRRANRSAAVLLLLKGCFTSTVTWCNMFTSKSDRFSPGTRNSLCPIRKQNRWMRSSCDVRPVPVTGEASVSQLQTPVTADCSSSYLDYLTLETSVTMLIVCV